MGYETQYSISVRHKDPAKAAACSTDVAHLAEKTSSSLCRALVGDIHEVSFDSKWFDTNDLKDISKRYPGAVIQVNGTGEDAGDIWKERWKDGESELTSLQAGNCGRFTGILTPEEETTDFDRARTAYLQALEALQQAAVRHVRRFLRRVTGREGCGAVLDGGNDADLLYIRARTWVEDEEDGDLMPVPVHLAVTTIYPDGETLEVEDDGMRKTELSLHDCPEDTLLRFVGSLDALEQRIAANMYKESYNEEEEIYEITKTE